MARISSFRWRYSTGGVTMGAVFGKKITLTIFGESHGAEIGCVLANLPSGIELDLEKIQNELQRRAPGNSPLATSRQEADKFEIVSGLFQGKTTGSPLCMHIKNSSQRSGDYEALKDVVRPGHADYVAKIKYKQANDYRGGGHFSGRITAPLVFAGAVAKQILAKSGVSIAARIKSIAKIQDAAQDLLDIEKQLLETLLKKEFPVIDSQQGNLMQAEILKAKTELDSVGGVIECFALDLPVGIGEPFFDSLESSLASMLFSIPAVKGVEFGLGFAISEQRGSQANDQIQYQGTKIQFLSNNNGGILGGISNALPLVLRVAIKPTPSIAKVQQSINLVEQTNVNLQITGRHDPCIVPRAVVVVEAATAWVLLDNLLLAGEKI